MILSTAQRFIFIHVPKTGGTSVHGALAHLDVFHRVRSGDIAARRAAALANGLPEDAAEFRQHTSAAAAIKTLGRAVFDAYYSFCFVRNPWDVAVSWFHYRLYTSQIDGHGDAKAAGTFEKYARHFLAGPGGGRLAGAQHPYVVADGAVAVRHVHRFEDFRRNFADVVAHLSLETLPLDHFNQSHHAPWTTYYTRETFAIVEKLVARDADLFGYPRDPAAYGIV